MPIIKNKKPKADLRRGYRVRLEIGIVLALLIALVLFNVHLNYNNNENFTPPKQETVKMKKVRETKIHQKPPPPPAPKVPVAVPNDAVINDKPIGLNSELNMNQPMKLPPPPKKAQKKKKQKHNVFVVVENMPKLKGGMKALQQNVHYPKLARKAGIEGTVFVQFIVNKKGIPTHIHVVRGIGGGCDQAAINAIKKARFTPGMQRGRPVPVRMSIPVRFQLQSQ